VDPPDPKVLTHVLGSGSTRASAGCPPAVVDIVLNTVFLRDRGDAAAIERGRSRLRELEPILEARFAENDFLAGDRPTIADLSLASSIAQLGFAKLTPSGKHTQRWFARVSAIEGVRRSLPQA
jgi:glutathione S-transferase